MDTVKKSTKGVLFLLFFSSLSLAASSNYCSRSELQFFNTYASTVINPAQWNESNVVTLVFGHRPIYQGGSIYKKESYLVRFSFHAKNDQFLVLRGDIQQVESRGQCWKTSLYFAYDLAKPEGFPEVSSLEGISVPFIGDNLNFKTCELLSRMETAHGEASHNEIISGTTQEGDKYNFWITYAKSNSLLKAFDGQRSKNAQTVFFETISIKTDGFE